MGRESALLRLDVSGGETEQQLAAPYPPTFPHEYAADHAAVSVLDGLTLAGYHHRAGSIGGCIEPGDGSPAHKDPKETSRNQGARSNVP
ncbi:hypothetical protein GCM10011380_29170 [Sphingomonas metalli]|uniref:Uncharacterized protein n=1 Tax=Sphingomonas metalli TaxID=1779358 RepID=A0A916WXR8_9SPHN|nr:hypothetical protein GCM10011380_29170 [Sphingomonas metalli]